MFSPFALITAYIISMHTYNFVYIILEYIFLFNNFNKYIEFFIKLANVLIYNLFTSVLLIIPDIFN